MKTGTFLLTELLLLRVTLFISAAQEANLKSARLSGTFARTNGIISQVADVRGTNYGRAEIAFTLASEGRYHVTVRGKGISGEPQELWLGIDVEPDIRGALRLTLTNGAPGEFTGFTANTSRGFDLAAGDHKLIVLGRSPKTQLESLALIPASQLGVPPPPPQGLRMSPAPP